MLSRLGFRNVCSQVKSITTRGVQTSALVCPADDPRRLKRPMYMPPVRLGFIPESWFTFFYPKTGVTGPYMFLFSVSTYLVSKEWYILEHEFFNGLSLLSIIMFVHIKYGEKIGKAIDKEVAEYDAELEKSRTDELIKLEDTVKDLEKQKWNADAQFMIYDVKKQNIIMQLEAAYRERLAKVYSEVKKRLDYQAQVEAVERRIAQRHMVMWITNSVLKAITPEQEKANLVQCIADLEALSSAKA